jgi:alkylation response protein AidB-like acyl-CoA dehydrogenase
LDINFSDGERRFRDEVRNWLHANLPGQRPLDTVEAHPFDKAWQKKQFDGGWAGINWPQDYGGRGLSLVEQIIWYEEYAAAGAPWIGSGFVGINHGGPTLIARGSEEQKRFHLPKILSGETTWCQGFSEPNAGSDLAGIRCSGRIEGDEIIVNGSKIWTSFADVADYQELLLRTDPSAQRHKGLSWVICDMRTRGITIRPIKLISGEADFCEVFYDEVRIPLANVVGGVNNGWSVAMSTLGFERGTAFIYEQVKLKLRVEHLLETAKTTAAPNGRPLIEDSFLAETLATHRAEVAALRAMTYRVVSEFAKSGQPGNEASVIRLFSSELFKRVTATEMELLGPETLDFAYGDHGPIHEYFRGFAHTIAGGASQIQRNIIGERMLGLPKSY